MKPIIKPSKVTNGLTVKPKPVTDGKNELFHETVYPVAPIILLYGAPKTGKTTLSYGVPDAVHIMTDSGTRNKCIRVTDWISLCDAVDSVPTSVPLVIDTIDGCLDLCNLHVAKEGKVLAPEMIPYGKGTAQVRSLWQLFVRKAQQHPLCLFIGHEIVKTKIINNMEMDSYRSQIPDKLAHILNQVANSIIYLRRVGRNRVLVTGNSTDALCGSHFPEWWWGRDEVNLGDDPAKAVEIFSKGLTTLK